MEREVVRMIEVVPHLDVDRPAAEVFAFVSDQLNAPHWQRGLHEVRRTTMARSASGASIGPVLPAMVGALSARPARCSTYSRRANDGGCSLSGLT